MNEANPFIAGKDVAFQGGSSLFRDLPAEHNQVQLTHVVLGEDVVEPVGGLGRESAVMQETHCVSQYGWAPADEKNAALRALVEHVVPGRMADARPPSASELRTTTVLRLPIDEASAKVRTGGPIDDEEDMSLPIWAGQLPLAPQYGTPIADPESIGAVPDYVTEYRRP